MKQRNDCLELQKEFHELEQGMHKGNEEYDLLRKRLTEIGKHNLEITKTTYWHWLTEKGDFPEIHFYATPPIGEAPESDRILITGTKAETRDMYTILQGLEVYQRVMKELGDKRQKLPEGETVPIHVNDGQQKHGLVLATQSLELGDVKPEYVFSGRVASFWQQFFGEECFLDNLDKISVPVAIIGTGYMRNYNAIGGETMNVRKRLEGLASAWDIPIKFIESWAL